MNKEGQEIRLDSTETDSQQSPDWNDESQVERVMAQDELELESKEQKRFSEAAEQIASKEKLQHIKIEIFFGAHGSEEDAQGIEKRFPQADIYIPEMYGWNENVLQGLRDLSYARITPEQFLKEIQLDPDNLMYGFIKKQMELVYNSFKPIVVIDVPQGHQLDTESYMPKNESSDRELWPNPSVNFGRIVTKFRESIKYESEMHNEREDYMISQLDGKIKEALALRPDLKAKDPLNILMFLGAAHTRVAHQLNKLGVDSKLTMSRKLFQFNFNSEASRRYSLGKEINVDLAAKALLENFTGGLFGAIARELTQDTNQQMAYMRKMVTHFSTEEIKDIFKLTPYDAQFKILHLLNQKGLSQPSSRADFEKFLSIPG